MSSRGARFSEDGIGDFLRFQNKDCQLQYSKQALTCLVTRPVAGLPGGSSDVLPSRAPN